MPLDVSIIFCQIFSEFFQYIQWDVEVFSVLS